MATAGGLSEPARDRFEQAAEGAAARAVRRIIDAVLRILRGSRTSAGPNGTVTVAMDPVVDTAIVVPMWTEAVTAVIAPIVVDTWTAAATATAADFAAAGLTPSVLGPDRGAAYLSEATNRLVGIGDTLWQEIAQSLAEGMDVGEGIPELAARVRAVIPVTEGRATRIARTECISASNAGSFAQAQALDDPTMTKIWQATEDDRTRETHREADGQRQPLLEAFVVGGEKVGDTTVGGWPLMFPGDPIGPPEEVINCFPGDVLVKPLGDVRKIYKRWYDGVLIRVKTAGGVELSGTPNHPVLTDTGWKPLQFIDEGDKVVKARVAYGVGFGEPQVADMPPTFAEFYSAAAQSGMTHGVVGSVMDFHGDGSDSKVEVVTPNGQLSNPLWTSEGDGTLVVVGDRHGRLFDLRGEVASAGVRRLDDGTDFHSFSQRSVRRCGEAAAAVDTGLTHPQVHGGATVSDGGSGFGEHKAHGGALDAEGLGYSLLRLASHVSGDDGRFVDLVASTVGRATYGDVGFPEPSQQGLVRDSQGGGYLSPGQFLGAEFDSVIEVDRSAWAGHVYNLETSTGTYTANGITVSNCRCDLIYDFDAENVVTASLWDVHVTDSWDVTVAADGPLTAAAQAHSGAMIALAPSVEDAYRLEVAEPPEQLHATLVYLGDDANLTPDQRAAILEWATDIAPKVAPFALDGFAISAFNPADPDRDTAIVLGLSGGTDGNGEFLTSLRGMATAAAREAIGAAGFPDQHEPYHPHITLAYTDDPGIRSQLDHLTGAPVVFDHLRVAFGGDVYDIPLGQPVEEQPTMDGPWDVTVAAAKRAAVNPEFEGKHERDSKGRFATMESRLANAISQGGDNPLAGFTREQLRRHGTTKLGLKFARGESEQSIRDKVTKAIGGDKKAAPAEAPAPKKAAPKKVAPTPEPETVSEETPEEVPTVKPTASTAGRSRGKVQDLKPGDVTRYPLRVTKVIDNGGPYIYVNGIFSGHELQQRYERDQEIEFFRPTPEEIARDKEPREHFAALDDPAFENNIFTKGPVANVLEDLHQGRTSREKAATDLRDSAEYIREAADRNAEVGNADNAERMNAAADALDRLANEIEATRPDTDKPEPQVETPSERAPNKPEPDEVETDGQDGRAYAALDWLGRTYAPAWLDEAGFPVEAQRLRDLPRVVDGNGADQVKAEIQSARRSVSDVVGDGRNSDVIENAMREAIVDALRDAGAYDAANAAPHGEAARILDLVQESMREALQPAVNAAAGRAGRDAAAAGRGTGRPNRNAVNAAISDGVRRAAADGLYAVGRGLRKPDLSERVEPDKPEPQVETPAALRVPAAERPVLPQGVDVADDGTVTYQGQPVGQITEDERGARTFTDVEGNSTWIESGRAYARVGGLAGAAAVSAASARKALADAGFTEGPDTFTITPEFRDGDFTVKIPRAMFETDPEYQARRNEYRAALERAGYPTERLGDDYRFDIRKVAGDRRTEELKGKTPEVYGNLLGDGPVAVKGPARRVVEGMQANGWLLTQADPIASQYTFTSPDGSKSINYNPGSKKFSRIGGGPLTFKAAQEIVGDAETKPAAPPTRRGKALTPEQQAVVDIAASPLIDERRQGGMMGLTVRERREGGEIIRKNTDSGESRSVRNPVDQADAEELGALVGRALGLRAPAMVRSGKTELEMEVIPGETGNESNFYAPGPTNDEKYSPDGQRIALMDRIISNVDRNAGNYILTPDGRIAPIDHGLAFMPTGKVSRTFAAPFGQPFGVTESEAAAMRADLQALEPEFKRLKRLDWFTGMMRSFDKASFQPDPQESGQSSPALTAAQQAVLDIAASPQVGSPRRQGGMMGITSLEDREGGKIIRKDVSAASPGGQVRPTQQQYDAELLAPLVAEAVGLRAPAVVASGAPGELLMEFIPGKTGGELAGWGGDADALLDSPDGRLIEFLDVIIRNLDRNDGNWIIGDDGRTVPIDHGAAFYSGIRKYGSLSDMGLSFTPGEWAAMRSRIEALRPQFERLNRGAWLDQTLKRFDKLKITGR